MKKLYNVAFCVGVTAFSLMLFVYDEAARPGPLSSTHAFIEECESCHIPWKGPAEEMCLQCHDFGDVQGLKPQIRFHEARVHCMKCHTEHKGTRDGISHMDHALLNENLLCTQCHLDPHEGLFGQDCRGCHGISTWRIAGFQHPSEKKRQCSRCHRPPRSHLDEGFWRRIMEEHQGKSKFRMLESRDHCWGCHITHRWSHLRMKHAF